ncbi:hypothetical protein PV328_002869 [Microctonus aethiopoides]|uniref:Amino acid transporter transmembrane domain-containing protein n=1 Tax=Microctonus aethiopoides TaxID=144406 RepID=A0AA39KJW2_9HYME|nr:hypothetical protein PV328_002869 [Microctonus aethiopoides]
MELERSSLLNNEINSGLNVFFATLCIIDIFGVFPIIALPHAMIQCGLLGILLVIVVFILQIYCAILLGKSWIIAKTLDPQISRKNRYPLAAVTELILGPKVRILVTVLLDLTVFGCGIPNLLVASQNLQLFGLKVSDNSFDLSFCYWLLVVGVLLCPLMWLGSPRDMKTLAICSTAAVLLTAMLVWWCIITDDQNLDTISVPTAPSWDVFISGYSMLAFQFDVHPTLMTIQVDMQRPQDINKAVIMSFFVSGLLFGITMGLAAWRYGGSTTANILQIAPPGYVSRAAILLSAIQLIFSSVIGHAALFLHLENELHIQRSFGWKRCAIRSALVVLGVAVGESVPRFDIVMSLIGGTLTGPLIFILPPIIYARAQALKMNFNNDNSMPEILSTAERRIAAEKMIDHKAHSQSTYYGMTNDQQRYSYIYYNDNEDNDEDSTGLLSDVDDVDKIIENKQSGFDDKMLEMIERNSEPTSLLIDATKPEKIHKRKIRKFSSIVMRPKADYNLLQTINWFGYFVVFMGILITVSSTYINIKNTIRFVKFTPPCIINASITAI